GSIRFGDVQSIFMSRCTPCHEYATDYSAVRSLAESGTGSLVYQYVIEGQPREMPPPGTPQSVAMTQEERLIIGEWVLAGAPLNGETQEQQAERIPQTESDNLNRESLMHLGR